MQEKFFFLLVLVQHRILFKFVFSFVSHFIFIYLALGPQNHGLPICPCASGAMDVGGGVRPKSLLRGLLFQSWPCLRSCPQNTEDPELCPWSCYKAKLSAVFC